MEEELKIELDAHMSNLTALQEIPKELFDLSSNLWVIDAKLKYLELIQSIEKYSTELL
jgi:hypothetical protein